MNITAIAGRWHLDSDCCIVGAVTRKRDVEIIGNADAALHVGVKLSTWSGYVARGLAPEPHRREVIRGYARPVWRRATLDKWLRSRPGQGARTDLSERAS